MFLLDTLILNQEFGFTLELVLRIALAALCGLAIGYERMSRFKVAGVKTHMIVCMSAALVIIVSKYGFFDSTNFDAARIAAQVVSGVGFLGAGIIYKRNRAVQGLTTAAGIWGTAAIGLCLGAGLYVLGILASIVFVYLRGMVQKTDRFQNGIQESYGIRLAHSEQNLSNVLDLCKSHKIVSYSLENSDPGFVDLELTLVFSNEQEENSWVNFITQQLQVVHFERF